MRKKIDEDYIAAVRKAVDALGGQSDLARVTGVPSGTISAIINPKRQRQFVLSTVYNRLYPFVSPYLPEPQEIPIGPSLPLQTPVSIGHIVTANGQSQVMVSAPGVPPVPVVASTVPVQVPVQVATPTAQPAPIGSLPADLTPGSIPAEVILHAMQGMEPEEKARFLKELYTDASHETDGSTEE